MIAAGMIGIPAVTLSCTNRYAVANATAPCAKLKMPEVW